MKSVSHHLEAAARATARGRDLVAIRHLRALVRLAPRTPAFWALLGDRLLAQDAYDAAVEAYRHVLRLQPGRGTGADGPDGGLRLALVHAALASAHAGAGRLDAAVRAYEAAVRIDPSPDHYVGLGELHEMRGRPRQARACYASARERDPSHVPALVHLADLDLWRRPGRARRLYLRALDVEPGHPEALASLAAIHMQEEAWAKARDCAEASLRSRPTVRAWVYLGHILLQQGEIRRARDAYGRAQRLDPSDVHPLYALGDLEWEEGNLQAAELAYRESLALDPRCADAALRLARFLLEGGKRPDEALVLARQGLALAPHHPWADWVRGWIATLEDETASA